MATGPDWEEWTLDEDDPFIHELDDPLEVPKSFSDEELASLFGEDS